MLHQSFENSRRMWRRRVAGERVGVSDYLWLTVAATSLYARLDEFRL